MKRFKKLGVMALMLLLAGNGWACDLCSYSVGLNPNYNQNQVGLRFRHRNFVGRHSHATDGHGHTHGASPDQEMFQAFELWGRWCPSPKWRIQMLLPYGVNTSYSQGDRLDRMVGLGDASVLAYYQVFQKGAMEDTGLRQRLFVGIGGVFPTGKHLPNAGQAYDPLQLPGTGAWGLMPAISYLLRKGNWGLGLDYNYRATTTNIRQYHFSDRHNFNANLFYQLRKKNFSFLPFVGSYAEFARTDQDHGVRQINTGGLAVFANTGFEAYLGGFSVTFMPQLPLLQLLNGDQGKNAPRFMTGVFYSF